MKHVISHSQTDFLAKWNILDGPLDGLKDLKTM